MALPLSVPDASFSDSLVREPEGCPMRSWLVDVNGLILIPFVCSLAQAQTAGPGLGGSSVAQSQTDGPQSGSEANDPSSAEDSDNEREYVRIRRNDRRLAVALETSIIRFADSKKYPGTTVDLVGAIHLGETQYYDQLNEIFKQYDRLLFEAVMPEQAVRLGMRPGIGRKGRNRLSDEDEWTEAKVGLQAISVLQLGMKDALGLDFQLSAIDYGGSNFVHADMTQEEFERSMARRGETFSQILAREMGKAAMQQQKVNPLAQQLDLVMSLLASDRVYRVRRIAAAELSKANAGDAFAGYDGASTIITERNQKVMEVLRRELGQKYKKIGIFYGAGHFPHMEPLIVDEFGYKRESEQWLTAWKLRESVAGN